MKDTDLNQELTIKELIICWAMLIIVKMVNANYSHETSSELNEIKHLLLSKKPELKKKA